MHTFAFSRTGADALAELINAEITDCKLTGSESSSFAIANVRGYQVQVAVTRDEDNLFDAVFTNVQATVDPADDQLVVEAAVRVIASMQAKRNTPNAKRLGLTSAVLEPEEQAALIALAEILTTPIVQPECVETQEEVSDDELEDEDLIEAMEEMGLWSKGEAE